MPDPDAPDRKSIRGRFERARARRVVIVVPSSIAWQWEYQIRCCLSDYRVVVIRSNLQRRTKGKNKGQLTSETDTPEERAQKWHQFQAGQVDIVILTFDALARTKVSEDISLRAHPS